MTLPARSSTATTPVVIPLALDGALRFAVAKLDPPFGSATRFAPGGMPLHEIRPDDAPSPEVRAALAERRDHIADWMRPAGPEAAAEEYRMLAATMEAREADDDTVTREQLGFIEATASLPAFALREACTAFRYGQVGSGRWMPKAGEVRREAEARLRSIARERWAIEAVLTAKVREPENLSRKAALLAIARGLVKTMPIAGLKAEFERTGRTFDEEANRDPLERRPEEPVEAYQARMLRHAQDVAAQPLPKVSPALRRSLGLPPEVEHQDDRFGDQNVA